MADDEASALLADHLWEDVDEDLPFDIDSENREFIASPLSTLSAHSLHAVLAPSDIHIMDRSIRYLRGVAWHRVFDIREIVTLLDCIGITGWAIVIWLTTITATGTAIFAQTRLDDMVEVHAYVRFWGASLWPGLVGTSIGSIAGLIRAWTRRPLTHEQWLRLLQDIFCRFLTFLCLTFATAGLSYLQHKDDPKCPAEKPGAA